MANFATLKAAIAAAIKQNGNNEITGNLLQQQLLAMVNSLGANYQFAGVATPTTDPGTPDQNVFYLASEAGTYTNFGGSQLSVGKIGIFKYNGDWAFTSLNVGKNYDDIIKNLQSTDQELFDKLCNFAKYELNDVSATLLNNSYISASGVVSTIQSEYWKVLQYSVEPGQTFRVKGNTVGNYGLFSMYGNGIPLYVVTNESSEIEQNIIIPDGVDTLFVAYISGNNGYIKQLTLKELQYINIETERDILENASILNGYYISGYGGGLVQFSSNLDYKVVVVNLTGGENLEIHSSGLQNNGAYSFIDSENNVISYAKLTSAFTEETFTVVAPSNARKVYIASYGTIYLSYKIFNVPQRKWTGKKWVVLGDSLTEINARTNAHYFDFVAEKTGITIINKGISGTGYKNGEANNKAFYQRVSDLPDCDVLTIFGSFNDNVYFSQMGTKDDTTTDTIGGCINTCLDNLFAANPLIVVGIVSPTPWQYFYPGVADSDAYVQLLKDICTKRGIPFYDLYHNSNLRPWESAYRALCYSKDDGGGVHPDEQGHRLISPRFEFFLNELLLY